MTTAKRVYLYLVSLVALILLSVGVTRLLGLLLGLLRSSQVISYNSGFDSRQLSLSLAMMIIGGGLWWGFWCNIQRITAKNPAESGATFRKLYLNAVQVVSALVGLSVLISSLDWLLGGAGSSLYPPMRIATLVTMAAVWWYHLNVSEKEGHLTPAARTLRRWNIYILSTWGMITLSWSIVQFIGNAAFFLPFWPAGLTHGSFWNSAHVHLAGIMAGGAAWWFFWFRASPKDAGSTLRQVYYYLFAIPASAVAGLGALIATLYRIIGAFLGVSTQNGAYFQSLSWTIPGVVVAAGVWSYHQARAGEEAAVSAEKHLSARRVYLYLMSFISLGTLVAALVALAGVVYELVIDRFGGSTLAGTPGWWQSQMSLSLSLMIVALPMWLYYWGGVLRMAEGGGQAEHRTRSRRVFVYAVLGLSIAGSVAAAVNGVYLLLSAVLGAGNLNLAHSLKWSFQTLVVSVPLLVYFLGLVRKDQSLGAEAAAAQKEVTFIAPKSMDIAGKLEAMLGYRVKKLESLTPSTMVPELLSESVIEKVVADIRLSLSAKVMVILSSGGWQVIPYQ
jgi:hypothetical protein